MRPVFILASFVLAALALACGGGRKGSAGFHLPDGDPVRGQAVFVSLQCHSCHRVSGLDLPAPVAQPPVPVELGGDVSRPLTDGQLVTAIIAPSRWPAPGYRQGELTSGRLSRMGDFTDAMSVRDLVDVVAFLQSRYHVVPPPPPMH